MTKEKLYEKREKSEGEKGKLKKKDPRTPKVKNFLTTV